MAQYLLRIPPSDGKAFLVFTYIWLKDVEKISKVPSALRNVNPTRAITWLVGCPKKQKFWKFVLRRRFWDHITKKTSPKNFNPIGWRSGAAPPPFLIALTQKFDNRLFWPILEINLWCHHSFSVSFYQEFDYIVKQALTLNFILPEFFR